MIEAYTIGIRLALEDGVSQRIGVIRQDLAALDRAVTISGIGLGSLARLGRDLARVPDPRMKVDADRANVSPIPDSRGPAKTDGQTVEIRSGHDLHDGRDSDRPVMPSVPALIDERRLALAPSVADPPDVLPGPREAAPVAPPTVQFSAANPVPGVQPTLAPILQADDPAELGRTISTGPMPEVPDPEQPKFDVPRELLPPFGQSARERTTVPGLPLNVPDVLPRNITDDVPRELAGSSHQAVTAPPIAVREPERTAVSKPEGQTGSIAPVTAVGIPLAPRVSENPARATAVELEGSESASSPQPIAHGELLVDGVRIGRWISDHLAERAVRPHYGFSGMDPRLSPAWPGVASGA